MQIKMIRGVTGEDGQEWHPGTVHEASDEFGRWLVDRGKAQVYEAPAAPVRAESPAPALKRKK